MSGETPGLRVRHLEILWAVMRLGSQHKAAQLVGLSQPAVSQIIRHIEDRLGMPLFVRTKGRLVPTPEAHQLFPEIDDIISRVRNVERHARDVKRGVIGRMMIAAVPGLSSSMLGTSLAGFLVEHPAMRVAIKTLPTKTVIDRVVSGEAGIGLVYGPIDAVAATAHVIGETEIGCVLSPRHRLAGLPALGPEELADEPIITGSIMPMWCQLVEQAFEAAGIDRNVACECSSPDLAWPMAAAGAGIAIVPLGPMPGMTDDDAVIRRFRPTITVPILALHSATVPPTRPAAALIEWLGRTAQVQRGARARHIQ